MTTEMRLRSREIAGKIGDSIESILRLQGRPFTPELVSELTHPSMDIFHDCEADFNAFRAGYQLEIDEFAGKN